MTNNFTKRFIDSINTKLEEAGPQVDLLNVRVSTSMKKKLDEWLKEMDAKAVEKQKVEYEKPNQSMVVMWELGHPYFGAIHADVTYIVTPTSMGPIIKARYDYLDEELDLTEYELW